MSQRYKGAIISATPPTTSTSSASGEWTLVQQAQAQGASAWPVANPDPYFNQVSLLLHGDGTNGGQNNTFLDSSPPGGYAVSFNGTTQYLSTSTISGLSGTFTIECWVYLTAAQSNYRMILSDANGGGSRYVSVNSTGLEIQFGVSTPSIASCTYSFSQNIWYHVAVVRNGTTISIYVNGTSQTVSNATQSGTFLGQGSSTYIGTWGNINNFWYGYISNLRIVNGTAVYTSNFTPTYGNLTAITGTQLLTCQSASIVDNSPNAFTITNNGGATVASPVTITRYGNTTQGTFSPFSLADGQWSNYFDGSGDYLSIPDSSAFDLGSSDFTIECWVYLSKTNSIGTGFVNQWSGGSLGWFFGTTTVLSVANTFVFGYTTDGSTIQIIPSATVASTGGWTHYAVSKSGSSVKLFVNGVQSGSTATLSGTIYNSTSNVVIGHNIDGGSTWFLNGYMSNVRVVKGTAIYTSNFTPSTTPLTAITNTSLLTCQSNRFKDNSSNNFTITPAGDTKVTAFSPFAPSAAYSASTNGGSAYFDGSGDYLYVAGNASTAMSTGDWTVEGWFYMPNGAAYNKGIITSCPSTTPSSSASFYLAAYSATQMYINVGGSGGVVSVTYNQGVWNHFAVVRSVNTATLYVNGVSYWTAGVSGVNWTDQNFIVGDWWTGGNYINAYMSSIRVVKGTALYTSNFTPPTAPLTAITNTQLLLNCTNAAIYDNAGKNDIETVGNAQVSTSVTKYGTGSMYFDGTGDYLLLPSAPYMSFPSDDFTIECWAYFTSFPTASNISTIVQKGVAGSSNFEYQLSIYNDAGTVRVRAVYSTNGSTLVSNQLGSLALNTWYHIAITRVGSTLKIWVDGVNQGSLTWAATQYSGSGSLSIGANSAGAGTVTGYIDDLRITKGVARYTANFVPPIQAFPDY